MQVDAKRRRRTLAELSLAQSLPPEYREVEWIGTAGPGPYIQTNVYLSNGPAKLSLKYQCGANTLWGADFFGIRRGHRDNEQGILIKASPKRDDFLASTGSTSSFVTIRLSDTDLPFSENSVVEEEVSVSASGVADASVTAVFTVNGVSATMVRTGRTCGSTDIGLSIFGCNRASVLATGKVFGPALAWNDGRLVLCAVPCYRMADGVIGMYDTVNGVFYTNAGSGSFTRGNEI